MSDVREPWRSQLREVSRQLFGADGRRCVGKEAHPTEYKARKVASNRTNATGVPMYFYLCSCGSYHLTHVAEFKGVPNLR